MPCHALSNTLLTASVNIHRCHLFVTGEQFLALHAFYGSLYEALDGFYDRFAERALANDEREKFKDFDLAVTVPQGDCIDYACTVLTKVKDSAENIFAKEDSTTRAMIDELVEFIDKMCWQLDAMGDREGGG